MENKSTKLNPPYGSINRLHYVFDLFSTHNFSQISPSLLRDRGFSGSDAFQTIAAIKFLGIIDSEGNKTGHMTKLQLKGDERTQVVLDIVKSAYKKLFDTVEEPYKLSKDDLYNDFISIYGLSGRLASTAVPNFLWLCKEAGLEVSEAPELKERRARVKNSDDTNKLPNRSIKKPESFHTPATPTLNVGNSVEVGEFKLVLPDSWDREKTRKSIVKGDFKAIYEELEKLSAKLIKNTEGEAG